MFFTPRIVMKAMEILIEKTHPEIFNKEWIEQMNKDQEQIYKEIDRYLLEQELKEQHIDKKRKR